MAERTDLLTITITKYKEPCGKGFRVIGTRKLGLGRRAFDFSRWSLIIERWWVR